MLSLIFLLLLSLLFVNTHASTDGKVITNPLDYPYIFGNTVCCGVILSEDYVISTAHCYREYVVVVVVVVILYIFQTPFLQCHRTDIWQPRQEKSINHTKSEQ